MHSHPSSSNGNQSPTAGGYKLRSRSFVAVPKSISTTDKQSIREALSATESPIWIEAMNEEFKTLEDTGI